MPSRSMRPATLRDSWRPKQEGSIQEWRGILLRRFAFLLTLLLVASGFTYLLFGPFYHPNVRFFYYTGGDYRAPFLSPVPFFRDEAVRFLSCDGYFDETEASLQFKEWTTPSDANSSFESLQQQSWRFHDLPIVYLSGKTTLLNKQPCLYTSNLVLRNPDDSAVPFEDIFGRLSQLPVERVLVFLDFEYLISSDQNEISDFFSALKNLLQQPPHSKLWVIASHSPGERSHLSMHHRSSAFLQSAVDGLSGKGRIGNDKTVTFQELIQSVIEATSELVKSESKGQYQQTPLYLGPNSRLLARSDWIVTSVPESTWQEKLASLKEEAKAAGAPDAATQAPSEVQKEQQKAQGWLSKLAEQKSQRVTERVVDEVSENISFLPPFIGDPIKASLGLNPPDSESPPAPPSSEENSSDTLRLPNGPDIRSLPDAMKDSLSLLKLAGEYCQYVERNESSRFRPWETIPVAWSYTLGKLRNAEDRLRLAATPDPNSLRAELVALIVSLHQLAVTGSAELEGNLKVWDEQRPAPVSPSIPPVSLHLLQASMASKDKSKELQKWIDDYDYALSQESPEKLVEWLGTKAPLDTSTIADFYYAKRFLIDEQVGWDASRRALRLWRRLDGMLADNASCNSEIRSSLESAFSDWLYGARTCLDRVQSNWARDASVRFDAAERKLDTTRAGIDEIHRAKRLWYRVNYEIEFWRDKLQSQAERSDLERSIEQILPSILKYHRELTSLIVNLNDSSLERIQAANLALDEQLENAETIWVSSATKLENSEFESAENEAWQINELLGWYFYSGEERDRLLKRWMVWLQSPLQRESPESMVSLLPPSAHQPVAENWDRDIQEWRNGFRIDTSKWSLQSSLQELRQQEQAVRQIRVDTPEVLNPRVLLESISRREWALLLQNRRDCLRRALRDASPSELAFHLETDLSLREKLLELTPMARVSSSQANSVTGQVVDRVSLESTQEEVVTLTLRNRSASAQDVWLIADTDSNIIGVTAVGGESIYSITDVQTKIISAREEFEKLLAAQLATASSLESEPYLTESRSQIRKLDEALLYPSDPTASSLRPSLILPPNESKSIDLRLNRTDVPNLNQKVVWKIVTRSQYSRLETLIRLPSANPIQLIAEVQSGIARQSASGIDLDLFPNRPAIAKFGLRTQSAQTGKYQVRFYIPNSPISVLLPSGELSKDASDELRSRLPELKLWKEFGEFEWSATNLTKWLLPEEKPPQSSTATEQPAVNASKTDPANAPKLDTSTFGFVVEIQNRESGRTTWRSVSIRTRHPRSYVDVVSSYNSLNETAELILTSPNPALLPPGGIAVIGRVRENLPKGTEMKLSGTLLPNSSLRLYCKVPVTSIRNLTIELDVEDYARAFIASIPCWRTYNNAPVRNEYPRLLFSNVLPETPLKPGIALTGVKLAVDAWNDSFLSEGDVLEVGWDEDLDREFENESPLTFRSDRVWSVEAAPYTGQGTKLLSNVRDFELTMPPPTAVNKRVNLLARIRRGGESAWSEPIPIVIDGDKPSIRGLEIRPATRVAQGSDLELRVATDDADLSGIASVQAIIDTRGILDWQEAKGAVAGVRQQDQSWKVTLPTAEAPIGASTLVVAAIDRAGNVSELERRTIDIVSEEDWQKAIANRRREIIGLISYSERSVGNAKVTLAKENGEAVLTVSADDRGLYRIPAIPPGKYKLSAVAVIKNRPRRFEEDITVTGEAESAIRKEIELK